MKEQEQTSILEQYKLYVELTDKIAERRQRSNALYMTALSSLSTVGTIFFGYLQKSSSGGDIRLFIPILIIGVFLCIAWIANIQSYKELAKLKYRVISEIESSLPQKPYTREWEILKNESSFSYRRLSQVEAILPHLFLLAQILIVFILALI